MAQEARYEPKCQSVVEFASDAWKTKPRMLHGAIGILKTASYDAGVRVRLQELDKSADGAGVDNCVRVEQKERVWRIGSGKGWNHAGVYTVGKTAVLRHLADINPGAPTGGYDSGIQDRNGVVTARVVHDHDTNGECLTAFFGN